MGLRLGLGLGLGLGVGVGLELGSQARVAGTHLEDAPRLDEPAEGVEQRRHVLAPGQGQG